MSTGTCTIHSWNDDGVDDEGDPPMGQNYNARLEYVESFNRYSQRSHDGEGRRGGPTTQRIHRRARPLDDDE